MNRITPNKKHKILITGGAGYIGSHVNKRLYEHGYETIVIDNLSRGNKNSVCFGSFFNGDIGNKKDLKAIFENNIIDGIIHFAALTDVGESVSNPAIYYHNNVTNTLNLLNFALEYHVKAFVFSSSAAIFGIPQKQFVDEEHPCIPINPYGQTKLMIENILENYDRAYGLKSCCLRYFNAAGGDPEGHIKLFPRKENNLIPRLLNSLRNPSQIFTLYGTDYPTEDGTCIRDYIHVFDLADAHIKGLERLLKNNISCAYNLGNGSGFSVKAVIEAVEKVTCCKLNIIEGEKRPGDPAFLIANAKKAQLELNWKPRYIQLEDMIEHAYKAMIF